MILISFGGFRRVPMVESPVANYVAPDASKNVTALVINGTVKRLNEVLQKINGTLDETAELKRKVESEYRLGSVTFGNDLRRDYEVACRRGDREVHEYNDLRTQTKVALADACAALGVPLPTHNGTAGVEAVIASTSGFP